MNTLAFDHTSIRQHGIMYTTLSWIKILENLFLVKPLSPKHFRVKNKINIEMERLQSNASWHLDIDPTCPQSTPHFLLCTLNTWSLHAHKADQLNDFEIMSSDVLCLQEAHISLPQNHSLYGLFTTQCNNAIHGFMKMIWNPITIIRRENYTSLYVEAITLTKLNNIFNISNIYARPNSPIIDIKKALDNITNTIYWNINTYIVGDFNIDMTSTSKSTKSLIAHMQHLHLYFLLNHTCAMKKPLINHI